MRVDIHKSEERGQGEYGWLSTRYSFSFADWYDPRRLGFGTLRVLNDDVIAPHSGFGTHSHRDMEIITIVMHGAVSHKDSLGNERHVGEGMIQVMSAGKGVQHSEHNNEDIPLELFQLWIESKSKGIDPRYEEKQVDFLKSEETRVRLVGENGGLHINQDASIDYVSTIAGTDATYTLKDDTHGVYLFVVEGEAKVGDCVAKRRDALCISETDTFGYSLSKNTKVLLVEVSL